MSECGWKGRAEMMENGPLGAEKASSECSNAMEYLCASDDCGGRVVRVVLGDSNGGHAQWMQCQTCNRSFGNRWIERQWESGLMPDGPAGLRPWPKQSDYLLEVVKRARDGDEEAKHELCGILANELKRWIERRLNVKWQDRGAAHHDVIQRVRERIGQLQQPEKFLGWLRRVVVEAGKRHSAPYLRPLKRERKEQPKQIGTKTILVDGKAHVVRVFEASKPNPPRQPRLEPLTDSIIMNWSKENRANYPRSVDFRRALKELPERWLLAVILVFEEGYSRAEAAEIMGCSKNRIYKLHKKARKRLQLLLPGYGLERNGKFQSRLKKVSAATGPLVERSAARGAAETSGNPGDDRADSQSWETILIESMWRHDGGSYFTDLEGEIVICAPDSGVDSNNVIGSRLSVQA